jgi:hypothetical protein
MEYLQPDTHREANNFTWEPIREVAKLFAGIFIAIVPVLAMLEARQSGAFSWLLAAVSERDGSPQEVAYFWLTRLLSALADGHERAGEACGKCHWAEAMLADRGRKDHRDQRQHARR